MTTSTNKYEHVLENWLRENRVQSVPIDQHQRGLLSRERIKTFDFLIYPPGSPAVIAEVKGRLYKGTDLTELTNLQCWVTMEDIRGMSQWQEALGDEVQAAFIFIYRFENIDVETAGRQFYDFGGNRYMLFAVTLDNYMEFMTPRSPKWQTVTLPAAKFRELAMPLRKFLFGDTVKA